MHVSRVRRLREQLSMLYRSLLIIPVLVHLGVFINTHLAT